MKFTIIVKNKLQTAFKTCLIAAALSLAACGQFHRVPPGHSLREAMARRPQVFATPAPDRVADASEVVNELGQGDFEEMVTADVPAPLPTMDVSDVPWAGVEPEDPAAYLVKGDQLRQAGDAQGAISEYQNAVSADPTLSLGWRNLALTYQEVGEEQKALAAFRKYKTFAHE